MGLFGGSFILINNIKKYSWFFTLFMIWSCFILLIQCKNKDVIETLTDNLIYKYIELDSVSDYKILFIEYFFDDKSNSEILFNLNTLNNRIDLYNFVDGSVISTFSIPNHITGFHVINLDSIICVQYMTNKLFLINSKGEIKNTWDLTNVLNQKGGFGTMCTMISRISYLNGLLFIKINAIESIPRYFEKPFVGVFKLGSDSLELVDIYIHNLKKYLNGLSSSFWPPFVIDDIGKIIVSFDYDHSLFKYLAPDFNSFIELPAKSNYINTSFTYDIQDFDQKSSSEITDIQNPSYATILYNRYLNEYYRIALHSQKYMNSDSTYNTFFDKSWSVLVLDSNFNLKKEIFIPEKKYLFTEFFISRDGFYISSNHELNPMFNPNRLSFIKINTR